MGTCSMPIPVSPVPAMYDSGSGSARLLREVDSIEVFRANNLNHFLKFVSGQQVEVVQRVGAVSVTRIGHVVEASSVAKKAWVTFEGNGPVAVLNSSIVSKERE
jgi:hypothetical protein